MFKHRFQVYSLAFTLLTNWISVSNADTLRTPSSTPGVSLITVTDSAGPWSVQIVEWDRRVAPELKLLPIKAARNGRERVSALETTSSMAARATESGKTVIAALNADFFTRVFEPVNGMMANGQWIVLPTPAMKRASLLLSADGKLWAGSATATAEACVGFGPDGQPARCLPLRLNRNATEYEHALLTYWFSDTLTLGSPGLFTVQYLAEAPTSPKFWQATLSPLSRHLLYHPDSMWTQLPLGTRVFAWATALSSLPQSGDTVTVRYSVSGPDFYPVGWIGGGPLMVLDGKMVVDSTAQAEGIGQSFLTTRHPRSAVAWNNDQSKVWLVAADGRQDHSVGMSLHELGEFLLRLGASEAINLDGGGSTALLMDGQVRNRPSDAVGERKVTNALLLVKE